MKKRSKCKSLSTHSNFLINFYLAPLVFIQQSDAEHHSLCTELVNAYSLVKNPLGPLLEVIVWWRKGGMLAFITSQCRSTPKEDVGSFRLPHSHHGKCLATLTGVEGTKAYCISVCFASIDCITTMDPLINVMIQTVNGLWLLAGLIGIISFTHYCPLN